MIETEIQKLYASADDIRTHIANDLDDLNLTTYPPFAVVGAPPSYNRIDIVDSVDPTDDYIRAASTQSDDAPATIYDVFEVGDRIRIKNSRLNDGIYKVSVKADRRLDVDSGSAGGAELEDEYNSADIITVRVVER